MPGRGFEAGILTPSGTNGAEFARDLRVPYVDEDPQWTLVLPLPAEDGVGARSAGHGPLPRAVQESLLTVGDGWFGTRGVLEEDPSAGSVLANGVYDAPADELPSLLPGPGWTDLQFTGTAPPGQRDGRRVLDLRTGVLYREQSHGRLRTLRFGSLARPGVMALRAEGSLTYLLGGAPLTADTNVETSNGRGWATIPGTPGGIAAVAAQQAREVRDLRVLDRVAGYAADPAGSPPVEPAGQRLADAGVGFDQLLAEQRRSWARIWQDCQIDVDGDPEIEFALRFALFQLVSAVPTSGEAALGARGLSGSGYAGHVFWDADVFVLPALAAVRPEAARAMLEYRIRRLDAARQNAAEHGHPGARFPWESAWDGSECTPESVVDVRGNVVPVETAELEEHIVADVAWAAWQYVRWTGDTAFRDGPGRPLITEAARYWSSRVERDAAGRCHVGDVIGPDEYHERVTDNAYTNVMARWNLRLAASLIERDGIGGSKREAAQWRRVAAALVDNYDPTTRRYEQFAGFYRLRDALVRDLLRPPVAADAVLGRDVTASSQIVKQADMLMLYLTVPEELSPGSLAANLAYYDPRTAHGSSLSPAVHAAVFARAEAPDEALRLLRMAGQLDLCNLNDTTGAGLHIATMGGLWQAVVAGFAGIRANSSVLTVDPHLPASWRRLTLQLRVGPARTRLSLQNDSVELSTDTPLELRLPDGTLTALSAGERSFSRHPSGSWFPS